MPPSPPKRAFCGPPWQGLPHVALLTLCHVLAFRGKIKSREFSKYSKGCNQAHLPEPLEYLGLDDPLAALEYYTTHLYVQRLVS